MAAPAKLSPETVQAIRRYGKTVQHIAKRYGLSGEALLGKLIAGESTDDMSAVSKAGARGKTQFMPGSRNIARQKYGIDPWRSTDEAVHAAALHLRGKINGSSGLEGYNPGGGQGYVRYILGQKVGDLRAQMRGGSTAGGADTPGVSTDTRITKNRPPTMTPARTEENVDAAILDALLNRKSWKQPLMGDVMGRLDSGAYTQHIPAQLQEGELETETKRQGGKGKQGGGGPASPEGDTGLLSGTHARIVPYSQRAKELGLVGTGKRATRNTSSGNVSDHFLGNRIATARDWSGTEQAMDQLAAEIAADLGHKGWKGGGVLNVVKDGYRYQLIYRTMDGGNHYNHVHLGIKYVGKRK